jgi:hypothetical protein
MQYQRSPEQRHGKAPPTTSPAHSERLTADEAEFGRHFGYDTAGSGPGDPRARALADDLNSLDSLAALAKLPPSGQRDPDDLRSAASAR